MKKQKIRKVKKYHSDSFVNQRIEQENENGYKYVGADEADSVILLRFEKEEEEDIQ